MLVEGSDRQRGPLCHNAIDAMWLTNVDYRLSCGALRKTSVNPWLLGWREAPAAAEYLPVPLLDQRSRRMQFEIGYRLHRVSVTKRTTMDEISARRESRIAAP